MNERINKKKVMYHFLNHVTEIVLILVVIALWIATDSFMKLNNWMNLLRSGSIKGLIALGVTMVLICGKIDLSTGSQVGLSGMFVAVFCKNMVAAGYNQTLACLIGMAVGIAFAVVIGLLHAFLQNTYDLPPFVVTLGTQYLMFGLAAIICNNYPIPNAFPNWYVQVGMGRLFGVVPYPVIIFFVAAVLCYFIMEHTTTGRCVYAVGGNQEAARLTGINVFKSKAFVFIAVQILAAIAGFINSAQVNQADWSYGKEWPTDCLSMAIIGGTSMAGGSGTIYGTVVGVVLISVLINGMTILNWNIYLQYIVRGAILIGSLVLMAYRDKYRD